MNDRGNIKWASLMLPEHVKMLQDFFEEEDTVDPSILSEDDSAEMEHTIQEAIHTSAAIEIDFKDNGTYKKTVGTIIKADLIGRQLNLLTAQNNKLKLRFDQIVSLRFHHK
ncbi:YolD-like family protein [Gracilibacillus caseinilyticus]|uniref:YolD-like family protein n=1 Tax=Gracilibacillus caseinilyticus TaxID=2932256 RepID=A0ABY4EUS3_9BACI|nr:YolD-like family protein [Gracilibacillus caseinilyticus]UOQ47628.1 YolD-like family protein [Gracilibacillus caseinilyticus]